MTGLAIAFALSLALGAGLTVNATLRPSLGRLVVARYTMTCAGVLWLATMLAAAVSLL